MVVVKKKGTRRVKCKRPSKVKLCGCFRKEYYSARRPARGFAGGCIVVGYILSRLYEVRKQGRDNFIRVVLQQF